MPRSRLHSPAGGRYTELDVSGEVVTPEPSSFAPTEEHPSDASDRDALVASVGGDPAQDVSRATFDATRASLQHVLSQPPAAASPPPGAVDVSQTISRGALLDLSMQVGPEEPPSRSSFAAVSGPELAPEPESHALHRLATRTAAVRTGVRAGVRLQNNGSSEPLDVLLEKVSDPSAINDMPDATKNDMTPLHKLCLHRQLDASTLRKAVDATKRRKLERRWAVHDKAGRTPLMYLADGSHCTVELLKAIEGLGQDVWEPKTPSGYNMFLKLCGSPVVDAPMLEVATRLAGPYGWGSQVTKDNNKGSLFTPLHCLCKNEKVKRLTASLLETATKLAGADAWSTPARNKNLPLHNLCQNPRGQIGTENSSEIFAELLEAATRHFPSGWQLLNNKGHTPLRNLCQNAGVVLGEQSDETGQQQQVRTT
eukprot:COSAG01_NODE_10783_length_2081_cov_1.765893_1_plen_425_part_00